MTMGGFASEVRRACRPLRRRRRHLPRFAGEDLRSQVTARTCLPLHVLPWQLCLSCEGFAVPEHGVEHGDELSGNGDDGDLLRSGAPGNGTVEILEALVCPDGAERGHVECLAHPWPAAGNGAPAPLLPAVGIE